MRAGPIVMLISLALAASGCGVSVQESSPSDGWAGQPSLPDNDGPSLSPMDPPYTPGVLSGVVVEASPHMDTVTFMFTGNPQCSVRRVRSLPAGAQVEGTAFLEVSCSPAVGARPAAEVSNDPMDGQRAAIEGRASRPGTANVTEAVQTSDAGGVLVWTIGLRRSAPWGVGSMSGGDGGGGPIVGVEPA